MPHMLGAEPAALKKMKPMLHLDLEEIKGLSDVEISDRLTLTVKAKVMGINKREDASDEATYTALDLQIQSVSAEREIEPET